MHIIFIPYGPRMWVNALLTNMESQSHKLKLWKGKKKGFIWIKGAIRQLPFGAYEYICPKEDADLVLNTLNFDYDRYRLGLNLKIIRKLLKAKKAPKYKKDHKYIWPLDHATIIPIGIREDGEYTEIQGVNKGFTHEAL